MGTREYIGPGGLRLHLDDPVSPQMAKQIENGQLQPVIEPAVGELPLPGPATDSTAGIPGPDDAGKTPSDPEPTTPETEAERPAKNGSVDAWRAYAIARGMDQAEADAANRTELQEYVQVLDDVAGE